RPVLAGGTRLVDPCQRVRARVVLGDLSDNLLGDLVATGRDDIIGVARARWPQANPAAVRLDGLGRRRCGVHSASVCTSNVACAKTGGRSDGSSDATQASRRRPRWATPARWMPS